MKIKQNTGRVVHAPLEYIFQMVEIGGSAIQKYDTLTKKWVPNREVTPFVLQPQLLVRDPDGKMASGDYTSQLVNVAWKMTSIYSQESSVLSMGDGFHKDGKNLVVERNACVGEVLRVDFSADYVDKRRMETQHFTWQKDLTVEAQAMYNVTLRSDWHSKCFLSPFKNRKEFPISVQLRNGDADVNDDSATYTWEWRLPDGAAWSSDFSSCAWLVSGAETKEIVVDQDYIQDILLRCTAKAGDLDDTKREFVTRLKRFYGMYNEEVMFVTGKYIFPTSETVVLEGKVTNSKGDIANPTLYFDMELFFAVGDEEFQHVGYGTEATITRKDLQTAIPKAGIMCRELSAFMPVADDSGYCLTDDNDAVITAQFPTTEREV